MTDVPGAEGGSTICPVCDAENTEEIEGGGLDYRCLECDAEFDPSGGRVVP
jgi:DNA-directed RNA polymerase subunit RPC12/RpoP